MYYILLVFYLISIISGTNVTHKRKAEDDYYLNYDYELMNSSIDVEVQSDSLILPIPEERNSKFDVLPNVDIPDNSLADADLKDHEFIDNLMYVYYGTNTPNTNFHSLEIIIFGAALSGVALLLTIFLQTLRKKADYQKDMQWFFFQITGLMCVSNFALIYGVHKTKNHINCLSIAIILHYLHLLISVWLFIYCLYIYKMFCYSFLKLKYIYLYGYGATFAFSLISFLVSPRSYETRKFCFMSVQKGMILNFMIPVSTLILLTMFYSLNGLRKINMELIKLEFNSSFESLNIIKNEYEADKKINNENEIYSLRSGQISLKLICVCQTVYAIVWFVLVLALENITNNSGMAAVYAVLSFLLNFYILVRSKSFFPTMVVPAEPTVEEEPLETSKDEKDSSPNKQGSSDSIPLLINIETSTELKEIPQDYISTISVN